MWKKWLAFGGILTLIILLDPTHTPAQPGFGKGFGKGGGTYPGGPGSGNSGSGGMYPGAGSSGSGGMGFGRRPDGGGGTGGFPSPGGPNSGNSGNGGMGFGRRPDGGGGMGTGGGMNRPSDPEQSWMRLQQLTGSTGDTVDLSKISPETRAVMARMAAQRGSLPLPDGGTMSKAAFLEHHAKSEAAKAAFAASGGSGGNTVSMTINPDGMGGRGMRGMGDPNGGWGQGGWGQGGWGQGGWGQGGWGQGGWDRQPFEKKETEEEKPVAMRYGKLPKDLPGWYDELDVDKDGQVSLFEWRRAGKETKEFTEMDLNCDGLVTADEYLRYARKMNIDTKVKAYEDSEGTERPKNWGLGAPVDAKGDGKGDGKGKWGGQGGWPPRGGDRGGDKGSDKGGDKGDKGSDRSDKGNGERKGNPWGKRP